jgi:hypothetical protein
MPRKIEWLLLLSLTAGERCCFDEKEKEKEKTDFYTLEQPDRDDTDNLKQQ